jgi:hypothetical protein
MSLTCEKCQAYLLLLLRYLLISLHLHLEEIIIIHDFLEHKEAANASSSQEDPYFSPC